MNAFKLLLMFFIYSSVALGADNVIIGGEKTTAYSYNPNGFCASGAEDYMKKLNEGTSSKASKIKSYKDQIKNLAIYENLLSETKAIKNRYEDSLQRIASGAPAKTTAEVTQKLGHVRAALKNGMTLSALNLLIKKQENKMNPPSVFTMENLCQGHEDMAICKKQTEGDKEQLNNVLKGFQDLAHELPEKDQNALQGAVKKVITSIPKELAPEAIIESITENSPTLNALVKNADSKEALAGCLSEEVTQKALNACAKLVGTTQTNQSRKALIETVSTESTGLTNELQRYTKVLNAAVENSKTDLEKALNNFDASKDSKVQSKLIFTDASKTLAKAGKAIEDMDTEKRANAPAGIANFFKDKKEADLFISTCDFSTSQANEEAKMKQCRVMMDKVLPAINAAKTENAAKVQKLSEEIKALADDDFKDTENLKEYIVERYLCACEKNKKVTTTLEESLQIGLCATPLIQLSKLSGLTKATGEIAETLYYNDIKMPMNNRGGQCNVDQKDLTVFNNSCRNPNINKQFKDICASIAAEVNVKEEVRVAVIKKDREMEKLNAENHVSYDSTSPTGYKVVKKKSGLRIFAEGAAPILPMMLPTILGNLQTRANIDMLATQGIYQKQMLYNYDIYNQNPWMYNYNYFMSPYSYGITPTTTGTTLGTSGTIGTGFSF